MFSFKSIKSKFALIAFLAMSFVPIYILAGFIFTHTIKYEARRVNLAGDLRYRSYKMGLLAHKIGNSTDTKAKESLVKDLEREIHEYDRILAGLKNGDTGLGLALTKRLVDSTTAISG